MHNDSARDDRGAHAAVFPPLSRVRLGLRSSSSSASPSAARKSSSSELPGSARLLCAALVSLALRRRGGSSGASRATLRLRRVLQQAAAAIRRLHNHPATGAAGMRRSGKARHSDNGEGHLEQALSCVTYLGCSSEPSSSAGWCATPCHASPAAALLLRMEWRAADVGLRTCARLALCDPQTLRSYILLLHVNHRGLTAHRNCHIPGCALNLVVSTYRVTFSGEEDSGGSLTSCSLSLPSLRSSITTSPDDVGDEGSDALRALSSSLPETSSMPSQAY